MIKDARLSLGEGFLSVHSMTSCATAKATASRTTTSASRRRPPMSGWMTVFSLAGTCPSCAGTHDHEKYPSTKQEPELARICYAAPLLCQSHPAPTLQSKIAKTYPDPGGHRITGMHIHITR